jgi:hypothetical protein
MSLGAHFVRHLRDPRGGDPRGFASELAAAGLELEARCFTAWVDHAPNLAEGHPPIAIATTPPETATAGDRWFDPCELTLMLHAGRAWLATRPTARWQMHGMLEVSTRAPREVQVQPPYKALDPARLTPPGDEQDRCTELTAGEATLYAWFFNKMLPHRFDWQSAEEDLPEGIVAQLWRHSSMEWVAGQHPEDEGSRLVITPQTIESEPEDDDRIIRGEYTRDAKIGFRTAVLLQTGLLGTISSWHILPEPVKLTSLVDRAAFR